ncbi:5-hydroxytryptamine receptor 1F [Hydra vulgaris]|uniref:5-hydroxytryptamine receptor 1F n=1 Tax=Hydra vulgaris TaxID=6087 RepID=A0ABM4DLD6_HYDVU
MHKSMMVAVKKDCSRMELLKPPLTTILGILFFATSVTATLGNSLVLIVVRKMKKKRPLSNLIISSLALSDFLVGTILGPLTSWQQIDFPTLSSCIIDHVRAYFVVLFVGSSVMTLAVISYDRFILLSKLTNYNKYITKKKILLLISLCWILPAFIPFIRQINSNIYLVNIFLLFVTPLAVLGIYYYFIIKAVHEKEKMLWYQIKNVVEISVTVSSQTISENTIDFDDISNKQKDDVSIKQKINNSIIRKERTSIALGKSVTVLIVCYVCCITPMNIWITLDMLQSTRKVYDFEIAYAIAMLCMQINSTINPMIYFSKNPDFKRGLKKLFTKKSEYKK